MIKRLFTSSYAIAKKIFKQPQSVIAAPESKLPSTNLNNAQPSGINLAPPLRCRFYMQSLPPHMVPPFQPFLPYIPFAVQPTLPIPTVTFPSIVVVIRPNGSSYIPSLGQWSQRISTPLAPPWMSVNYSPQMIKNESIPKTATPPDLYESNYSNPPIAYNSNPGQTTGSSTSTESDDPDGSPTIEFIKV